MILPVEVYASGLIIAKVLCLLLSNFYLVNRSPYSTSFSCLEYTVMTEPRKSSSIDTPGQAMRFRKTFFNFRSYYRNVR